MKTRAAIDPITLGAVALLALGAWFAPSFKQAFTKKAPVEQAQKANAELAQARAEAKAAQDKLDQIKRDDEERKAAQIRNGQQMIHGAATALERAPASPEVRLASSFASRAELALALANGALSKAEKAEIVAIVDGALSKVEAERDAAVAALARKDAELQTVTAERKQLAAQLPVVTEQAQRLEARAVAAETVASRKQTELQEWAKAKQAADEAANGFSAQANKLAWWLCIIAGAYVFIHWILPSLTQEYPNNSTLAHVNKVLKSLTSSHE